MALGYENTGIAPGLISKAGSAMAESIRQTGEKIRGDIIQHNTDKQVVGLLNDAKTLDVASPTFQNELIGVLGKYPMALGDDRAKIGLNLLNTAWQQQQQQTALNSRLNSAENIARIRKGGNGLAADLPPLDLNATPEMPMSDANTGAFSFGAGNRSGVMGRFGAGAGNGMQFGAGMRDQGGAGFGTSERQLPNDLPTIPEPGGAQSNPLFDTDKVLRGISGLDRATYAKTMARTAEKAAAAKIAGEKPKNPITKQIPGVGLVQYNPDTQEWNTVVKSGTPERWLNGGDEWINPKTGARVPIDLSQKQQEDLKGKEEAANAKAEEAAMKRALDALNSKRDVIVKDRDKKRATIESFEKSGKPVPSQNYEELRNLDSQLRVADELISEMGGSKKQKMRWDGNQLVPIN